MGKKKLERLTKKKEKRRLEKLVFQTCIVLRTIQDFASKFTPTVVIF